MTMILKLISNHGMKMVCIYDFFVKEVFISMMMITSLIFSAS